MKKWWWVLCFAGAVFVGCNSSETTSSTTAPVAISGPTSAPTSAPRTTLVSTTAAEAPSTTPVTTPPTTLPAPTTAPPTPAETAQAEIGATLEAMYADIGACWAAPNDCDIDTVLARYFDPSDDWASNIYRDVWDDLKTDGNNKVSNGRIDRTVAWVTSDADGMTGTSFTCEIDNSINVPNDLPVDAVTTLPADSRSAYLRYYFEWVRQPDATWRIVHSESGAGWTSDTIEYGELPSLSQSEIASCF